jgi:hypothetical protein
MSDAHELDEQADEPAREPSGERLVDDASAHTARAGRRDRWLEMVITVALGLAAIVGSYAAYRNEQSNHHATVHFSEGITNFDDAGQLFATANSTLNRDQAQFIAYVTALHDNKPKLANFIRTQLMDARLQSAVAWWSGPANMRQPHPAPTPFVSNDPNYAIPAQGQAADRTAESKRRFDAAKHEQERADHYELIEVILATALFLYGIAGVTSNMTVKLGTLGTGLAIFLVSLVLLFTG